MRLGLLGSIVGVVLLASGSASAQRYTGRLPNAAQQSARASNGRFLPLRPAQRALQRSVRATGTRSGGAQVGNSTVALHYAPATATAPGRLQATVPDYYRGTMSAAHTDARTLRVTDVHGVEHTIPMSIHVEAGARDSGYSHARIAVQIPRGVTVSQDGLRAALQRSNVMDSGELQAATR